MNQNEGKMHQNCAKNWARVIRKYFNWRFWHLNLILETWNWKSIKNTWSIEAKILEERLEIQAHFKVSFLRRNAETSRRKNFKASEMVFYHNVILSIANL